MVSASPLPETSQRPDWPRLVARKVNNYESRIKAAERIATRTITASATVSASDVVILADATSAAITITLPAAASSAGRVLYIKKIDASANAVTIDGNASETIDDALTKANTTQYLSYTIVCDGAEWWIV